MPYIKHEGSQDRQQSVSSVLQCTDICTTCKWGVHTSIEVNCYSNPTSTPATYQDKVGTFEQSCSALQLACIC